MAEDCDLVVEWGNVVVNNNEVIDKNAETKIIRLVIAGMVLSCGLFVVALFG